VRHCLHCDAPQHDFTSATEREALAVFAAHGNRLCGTFLAGPGGEVRFRAERPSRAPHAVALMAMTLAACEGEPAPSVVPEPPSTGQPVVPPSTTIAAPPSETSMPDHTTDASPNENDHAAHAHQHPPVTITAVGGVSRHISGGAVARPPHPPIEGP